MENVLKQPRVKKKVMKSLNDLRAHVKIAEIPELIYYIGHSDTVIRSIIRWRLLREHIDLNRYDDYGRRK